MEAPFAHLVFVDFENVPTVDLDLVSGQSAEVLLFIGAKQKIFSLPLVQQIRRLAMQVQLIEVGKSGRNALDMVLAYHLGQSAAKNSTAQFYIVSKDTDFDPLIAHMCEANLLISRHESFAALPFLPSSKGTVSSKSPLAPGKNQLEDRRAKFIVRLRNPGTRNRPSKKSTLLSHIRNDIAKNSSDAEVEDFVQDLVDQRVLTINEKGRVTYPA